MFALAPASSTVVMFKTPLAAASIVTVSSAEGVKIILPVVSVTLPVVKLTLLPSANVNEDTPV